MPLLTDRVQKMGLDSVVGTAPHYGLDSQGIKFQWGARFSAPIQNGHGTHPASSTMHTVSLSWVKRPGRGVNHPPHLSPRLKKG